MKVKTIFLVKVRAYARGELLTVYSFDAFADFDYGVAALKKVAEEFADKDDSIVWDGDTLARIYKPTGDKAYSVLLSSISYHE